MLKQYIVDAFTDHVSTGNPAAVCVVDLWRSDAVTQGINCENNLSETALAVKEPKGWRLRWLPPSGEIDL